MRLSRAGVACAGLLLGGAQVLLVRQALSLSGGDESVFAVTLTLWLVTMAIGSLLGSATAPRLKHPGRVFAVGLLALFLAVPAAVILFPLAAIKIGWIPGTVPGGVGLLPALGLALLPVGLIGGALFPIACRLLNTGSKPAVTLAYLLESAGSFIAGIVLVFYLLNVSFFGARLHPGMDLLKSLQTPYGLLEVTRRAEQISVFENNLLLANSEDPASSEERAYLTLAQHPDPRRVLWIGGSLGGSLSGALQHASLERLDLVEINPELQRLSRWFPQDQEALHDPRVSFHLDDGRRFLAQSSFETYDLISLNQPGPRTARLAKFYTVEGFRTARRALKPGGVLTFTISSSEDFLGADLALLLASLRATLQEVFPQVVILPGANAIFVAGDSSAQIVSDFQTMMTRLNHAGIQPLYWDGYRLEDRFSTIRLQKLKDTLDGIRKIPLNRDASPTSFYFNQVVWSRQTRGGGAEFLKGLRRIFLPVGIALLIAVIAGGFTVKYINKGDKRKLASAWAVVTVGMTGISLEILALIGYQVRFGSGYREVGLLTGLYMAGLALGAFLAIRLRRQAGRYFIIVQTHWILAAGVIIPLMAWEEIWGGVPILYQGWFWLYMLMVGILGGAHFPLALEFGGLTGVKNAGRFFALDLLGAAIGGMVIGLIALPLAGITICAGVLALLNLVALGLLLTRGAPSPA